MSKPGRNKPCRCGSGRKFKFCCGAVPIAVPDTASRSQAGNARQCGACTACCQGWAEGEIRGYRMHPGVACHFLIDEKCSIYEARPQSPCRNFVCGWLMEASPFPDAFRPDRCGVIVVPMRWRDRAAYVLLSAGRDPSFEMLEWMQRHAQRTGEPFFYQQGGERLGYGPAAFQLEMLQKLQQGARLW